MIFEDFGGKKNNIDWLVYSKFLFAEADVKLTLFTGLVTTYTKDTLTEQETILIFELKRFFMQIM